MNKVYVVCSLLLTFYTVSATNFFVGAPANCANAYNCNEDPSMVTITCDPAEENRDEDPCTCDDVVDEVSTGDCQFIDLTSSTFSTINCESLCAGFNADAGGSAQCEYYKQIELPLHPYGGSKACYLMNDGQCASTSQLPCNPEHCQSGSIRCEGDASTEDPPTPPEHFCPVNTDMVYSQNDDSDNYIHWYCFNHAGQPLSIYDNENATAFKVGSRCVADQMCFRYPNPFNTEQNLDDTADYSLTYECVENEDQSAGEWKWVGLDSASPDNTYDAEALEDFDASGDGANIVKVLKDPTCNGLDLKIDLDSFNQEGLYINCNGEDIRLEGEAPKVPTVPAENHCLLLCDFYPALEFYTAWKNNWETEDVHMGQRTWYYKLLEGDDTAEHELNDSNVRDMIRCWL